MILESFKYSANKWTLDSLTLGNTNLIVGKNSVGKTRTLDALLEVRLVLSQDLKVDDIDELDTELTFAKGDDKIIVSIKISSGTVVKENLTINGSEIIKRNTTKAVILSETVNPPADELLMHVRRDVTKLPIIEDVINWAASTLIRSFIHAQTPTEEQLYNIIETFTPKMKKHVLKMANKVGFPLTMLDTASNVFKIDLLDKSRAEKLKFILLKERGITQYLFFNELSDGMRRTILLFIMIESLINSSAPALFAIDDLGEGLDYEKASKVGKLLFETCESNNIQFIATSNEEWMMNIVDIDKWNILIRKGQKVKSITSKSKPEIFENFRFSGLNNFDFFTSDVFNSLS